MPLSRGALLAGIAALSIGGLAGMAHASTATHKMVVPLPDGTMETITYTGNTPPGVALVAPDEAMRVPIAIGEPFGALPFMLSPPPLIRQIQAMDAPLDHLASAIWQEATTFAATAMPEVGTLTPAAMRALPPGTQSYTFVGTLSGSGVCGQSVEVTRPANGDAPQVVRHSYGSCASAGITRAPAARPQSEPAPGVIQVRDRPPAYGASLTPAAYWRR